MKNGDKGNLKKHLLNYLIRKIFRLLIYIHNLNMVVTKKKHFHLH